MKSVRSSSAIAANAGVLAVDIIRNNFHRPFVDGKSNKNNIEEAITVGILSGNLVYYIDQEIVDLAVQIIDELIEESNK